MIGTTNQINDLIRRGNLWGAAIAADRANDPRGRWMRCRWILERMREGAELVWTEGPNPSSTPIFNTATVPVYFEVFHVKMPTLWAHYTDADGRTYSAKVMHSHRKSRLWALLVTKNAIREFANRCLDKYDLNSRSMAAYCFNALHDLDAFQTVIETTSLDGPILLQMAWDPTASSLPPSTGSEPLLAARHAALRLLHGVCVPTALTSEDNAGLFASTAVAPPMHHVARLAHQLYEENERHFAWRKQWQMLFETLLDVRPEEMRAEGQR